MKIVSVEEAKKNLDEILKNVEKGEEIVLKVDDKEFLIFPKKERKLGTFKGKIEFDDSVKEPLPEEITKDFYN